MTWSILACFRPQENASARFLAIGTRDSFFVYGVRWKEEFSPLWPIYGGESPPKRGVFFSLQVYKIIWISLVWSIWIGHYAISVYKGYHYENFSDVTTSYRYWHCTWPSTPRFSLIPQIKKTIEDLIQRFLTGENVWLVLRLATIWRGVAFHFLLVFSKKKILWKLWLWFSKMFHQRVFSDWIW